MKNSVLVFTALFCLSLLSFAQQASKTLDFIQTKDSRKLYGKITEMDPKDGISIQTYGDGNVIKLKHDEIELVKMGSNTVEVEKEKKSESIYRTAASLCYTSPFIDVNPSNSILFNDTNNFGFNRVGIHVEPTLIAKGKSYFGLLIGYEKGRNFSIVPVGLTIKLGKKINDKNMAYLNLMGGIQINNSKLIDFIGNDGYHEKETQRRTSGFAGIGIGFLHNLLNNKLFADITYRFDHYSVWYYGKYHAYDNFVLNPNTQKYDAIPIYGYVRYKTITADALQIRVGIMF